MPTIGLASYKLKVSVWNQNRAQECHKLSSLQQAVNKWLERLQVDQPDYNFYICSIPPIRGKHILYHQFGSGLNKRPIICYSTLHIAYTEGYVLALKRTTPAHEWPGHSSVMAEGQTCPPMSQ
ncbi:hypothetical protein YC2023_031249 [Brassica napus]